MPSDTKKDPSKGPKQTPPAAKGAIFTGLGGFDIDGMTYVFDSNTTQVAPVPSDRGDLSTNEGVNPDLSAAGVHDLSTPLKITLATYLSDATKGKHGYAHGTSNKYTVDSPMGKLTETSVVDEKGYPLRSGQVTNESSFVNSDELNAATAYSREYASLESTLTKGKAPMNVGSDDGHTLLKGVTVAHQPSAVHNYTSAVLRNNRFTAASPIVDAASTVDPPADYQTVLFPIIDGVRTPRTQLALAQVGAALSMRATHELLSGEEGYNPNSTEAVAAGLLPSPTQLGVLKVNNELLLAGDVLKTIADEEVAGGALSEIAPFGGQSWGTLNNVHEPFIGVMNLGQMALALALVAGVLVVFEAFGLLLSLGSSPTPTPKNKDGIYSKGRSTYDERSESSGFGFPPDLMSLLGLHGTSYPFGKALQVGAAAFFLGARAASEGFGGQVVAALASTLGAGMSDTSASGFNICVARAIVRSGLIVAQSVAKIGEAFASNPISGVQSIFGLLQAIKESRIVAAMNVFTTIGDALLINDPLFNKDLEQATIDNDLSDVVVGMSRMTNVDGKQTTKLAWSSNRSPVSYLLPDSTVALQLFDNRMGSFPGPLIVNDELTKTRCVIAGEGARRIPQEPTKSWDPDELSVKTVEAALEAEYVPFYFHDLRTNEIISFHAFLASLTDDYAANWEAGEYFGRVDPVKIYKNTIRKIGLSFYIVSTSRKDFDEMWVKINKLLTLVYPQYTRGRLLTTDAGETFVQPFSQLMSASPMIRLRLGDLLRSNYSRFALARLFGADSNVMTLDGKNVKFSGSQKLANAMLALMKDPVGKEFNVSAANINASTGTGVVMISISNLEPPDPMIVDQSQAKYLVFKVTRREEGDASVVAKSRLITADELIGQGHSSFEVTKILYHAKMKLSKFVDKEWSIPNTSLIPTMKTFNDLLIDEAIPDLPDNVDKIAEFLNEDKNALVKSFKSVGGKGLAGTIDSMNFDWFENVPWQTDEPGGKAPMFCKVSIAFSPIHDISPGIDHQGYNRAPVYPVGNAMKNRNDTGR